MRESKDEVYNGPKSSKIKMAGSLADYEPSSVCEAFVEGRNAYNERTPKYKCCINKSQAWVNAFNRGYAWQKRVRK